MCKSFHGHSQHADVTAADMTHNHPSKVTTHTQRRKGTKVGMGITISVTWLRKPFLGGEKLGAAGTEVLFVRFTEFLSLKNPSVNSKPLKIAYISGLTKKGKSWKSGQGNIYEFSED